MLRYVLKDFKRAFFLTAVLLVRISSTEIIRLCVEIYQGAVQGVDAYNCVMKDNLKLKASYLFNSMLLMKEVRTVRRIP